MRIEFEKCRLESWVSVTSTFGLLTATVLFWMGQAAQAQEQPQIRPALRGALQTPASDMVIPPQELANVEGGQGNGAEADTVVLEDARARVEPRHVNTVSYDIRPPARSPHIPKTRWQHMQGHSLWTRAAISALKSHGSPLVEMVPRDIADWCPAYSDNDDDQRRAFWVGYMSALAKHESTYKPWAVGGGGRWYGLLQILPATARGYKCNVGTGEALKNGAANLSCGVRIMAFTVKRDGVIHGRDKKWRGVSADWGPMRSSAKRQDMAGWLKRQNYCRMRNRTRPKSRP